MIRIADLRPEHVGHEIVSMALVPPRRGTLVRWDDAADGYVYVRIRATGDIEQHDPADVSWADVPKRRKRPQVITGGKPYEGRLPLSAKVRGFIGDRPAVGSEVAEWHQAYVSMGVAAPGRYETENEALKVAELLANEVHLRVNKETP